MILFFMLVVKYTLDILVITSVSYLSRVYGMDRVITVKNGGTVDRVRESLQQKKHQKSKVLIFGYVQKGVFSGVTNEILGNGFNHISRLCKIPILVMKMDCKTQCVCLEVLRTDAYPDTLINTEELRTALSSPWSPYSVISTKTSEVSNRVNFQCNPTDEGLQSQQLLSSRMNKWRDAQTRHILVLILLFIMFIIIIYTRFRVYVE